jgi:hypothetical protein
MASTPVDIFIHDTYYIVAHIHYVVFGGSIFGAFAAIYYWFPKMFGRMMNETLGKIHFALTFIGFNWTFFPMHILGIGGHMRRIYDPTQYDFLQPLQHINVFITYGALILGFSQLIFIFNFFWSMFAGKVAGKNPWQANTLEWEAPSPPGTRQLPGSRSRPSTAARTSTARRSFRRTTCPRRGASTGRPPSRRHIESMGLHRFAVLTAGATFVLLFIGGLVTSTGSGLAVPDWPLSFGMVFPPMVGGVLFEHGHRLAASAVGILTVALALWTVVGDQRPAVRALGLLALLAVVLQGVLGGVTVLYKLPLAVSVTHACLAQVFFCLTVTLAVLTGTGWSAPRARHAPASLPVWPRDHRARLRAARPRRAHAPHGRRARDPGLPARLRPASSRRSSRRTSRSLRASGRRAGRARRRRDRRRGALRAGDATRGSPACAPRRRLVVLQVTLGALTIWSRRAVAPDDVAPRDRRRAPRDLSRADAPREPRRHAAARRRRRSRSRGRALA